MGDHGTLIVVKVAVGAGDVPAEFAHVRRECLAVGAPSHPSDDLSLVEHPRRAEVADVFGDVVAIEQPRTRRHRQRREVFGQLAPHWRVGDDAGAGDVLLDLAADVSGVPGRTACPQPGQHLPDRRVPVEHPDPGRLDPRRTG